MSAIPAQPVSPRVFVEDVVPALFAAVELDEAEAATELRLGVVLLGDEGGEWALHFVDGELGIASGRDERCELTLVQTVRDWRSAIWEGRPALIAEGVALVREEGAQALQPPRPAGGGPRPDPLKGISDLRGLIELRIEAEEDDAQGDWCLGVLVGEGALPESPQATIRLGMPEAEAIRVGDLHPLEALISGQLQLEGDLGLILQLQAIAMTAASAAGGGFSR
jgi:hypothetical protein